MVVVLTPEAWELDLSAVSFLFYKGTRSFKLGFRLPESWPRKKRTRNGLSIGSLWWLMMATESVLNPSHPCLTCLAREPLATCGYRAHRTRAACPEILGCQCATHPRMWRSGMKKKQCTTHSERAIVFISYLVRSLIQEEGTGPVIKNRAQS